MKAKITILLIALACMWLFLSGCRELEVTTTPSVTAEVKPSATTQALIPTIEISSTPSPTWTPAPTITPDPYLLYGIYWSAGFETGNLSEYTSRYGEFLQQSAYGSYQIVTGNVISGNYAVGLTIDTSQLGGSQSAAAYLAYYNNPDQGYYSAWLYIPEEVKPLTWWNIWQWKSTYNGNSDQSLPMWILDLTASSTDPNELILKLVYRPDSDSLKQVYSSPSAVITKGEWVHISTYYKKSMDSDGTVGVWLNGEEVFYIENAHTVLKDNTLYWLINNYTSAIQPSPSTIYFDDIIISAKRIEPDLELP